MSLLLEKKVEAPNRGRYHQSGLTLWSTISGLDVALESDFCQHAGSNVHSSDLVIYNDCEDLTLLQINGRLTNRYVCARLQTCMTCFTNFTTIVAEQRQCNHRNRFSTI